MRTDINRMINPSANDSIYEPGGDQRPGLGVWPIMLKELWDTRELIGRLALRDISTRYRQSLLGYLWAIIVPLITVAIFTFLTSKRVLPIGQPPLPYPVFALWSLIIWQLFAGVLSSCTQSLAAAGSLVTKMSFQKEALVIAAAGQPLFDFIIKLVLVIVVFTYYEVLPATQSVYIPLLLLPLMLLAVGLGFFFSIANLVIRDVGNVVGMIATFGMFAAPVLYPPPVTAPYFLVNILNPFSPILIASQDLIVHGELRHADLLWGAVVFAVLVFLVGWRVFRLVMRRIAERA